MYSTLKLSGGIQGKTTRKRPDRVITGYIHVPDDIMNYHKKVVLAIDIMMIAEMPFLITTSRNIQFTTVEKLNSKSTPLLAQGIIKVANLYKRRGFFIDICLCSNEYEGVRTSLQDHGIKLNICAPNEHVPEVERNIRTIKERVRGMITILPFGTLPPVIIVHAVVFSIMWLNCFHPKGGVSKTISPQAIVTGMSPDAEKHCQIPFGAYAQVHVEPNPSKDAITSRTVGGISLGLTENIQGTYKFLSLLTGRVINARSFTPLPMPKEVILAIENMNCATLKADEDGKFQVTSHKFNLPTNADDISLEADSRINTEELEDLLDESESELESRFEQQTEIEGVSTTDNINVNNDSEDIKGDDKIPDTEITENQCDSGEDMLDDENNNNEQNELEINKDDIQQTSPRTHYITRSGRPVCIRKDLYENYNLSQIQDINWNNESSQCNVSSNLSEQDYSDMKSIYNSPHVKCTQNNTIAHYAFTQYSLKQGLQLFPVETRTATMAEIQQLHDMEVFQPVEKTALTQQELMRTLSSITFIKQKRCGRIKARTCADGRPQRLIFEKWEAASPTVRTELVLLASVIDAVEKGSLQCMISQVLFYTPNRQT
jgi:hypothetical protein